VFWGDEIKIKWVLDCGEVSPILLSDFPVSFWTQNMERKEVKNMGLATVNLAPIPMAVIERFAREQECSVSEAFSTMRELSKFLVVCAQHPGENAPSRALDDPWHTFILFTQPYATYCFENLGRFIHHAPTGFPMNDAYKRTRARALEMFGELDPVLWPKNAGGAAICNDCCEDNPGGEHPQG